MDDDLGEYLYWDHMTGKELADNEIKKALDKYGTFRITDETYKQIQPAADLCQRDTPTDLHQGEGQHISDGATQQSSDSSTQA